jgi:hypothetical protein
MYLELFLSSLGFLGLKSWNFCAERRGMGLNVSIETSVFRGGVRL